MQQLSQRDSYWSFWGRVLNRLGAACETRLVLVVTDIPGGPAPLLKLIADQAISIDSLSQLALPHGTNLFYMDNMVEHAGQTYCAVMRRGNQYDTVVYNARLSSPQVHNLLVSALQAFRRTPTSMAYLLSPNLASCLGSDFSKSYYKIDYADAVATLVASPSYPARNDPSLPIWAPEYARRVVASTPFSGAPPFCQKGGRECKPQEVKNQVAVCLVALFAIIVSSTCLVLGYEVARRSSLA